MLENLSGETLLFPILGDPVKFAKSPQRLTQGFEARGHNAICIPMLVADHDLDAVMRGLTATPNVRGLLVTMPHKFAAFAYCASSFETSRLLSNVSVMRRNADGSWHGAMFDGHAFVKAQIDKGAVTKGARVLLLGAGAAGSAIAIALLEAGVQRVIVHDHDARRAAKLIEILGDMANGHVEAGPADPTGCDMVCNATPMGMGANDPLPVDPKLLKASMFVGDVVAGHGVTPLLQAAQNIGCKTADGVQMVEAGQAMMLDFMLNT